MFGFMYKMNGNDSIVKCRHDFFHLLLLRKDKQLKARSLAWSMTWSCWFSEEEGERMRESGGGGIGERVDLRGRMY